MSRALDSGSQTAVQPLPRAGREFGAYRILKLLGAGGMGEVYLGLDMRLGRHIALKFLPRDLTTDEAALRRFQQEARTASALNHPNILTIYEIGQAEGELFIASEYIDGITLRAALDRGKLELGTALGIAAQVAAALTAAHSAGVVHRDLKPGNIMIRPDGYVKVIDFGLAKLTQAADHDTRSEQTGTHPGAVAGTLDYMSPEQARGLKTDERTDLWSLGVVLYEMVAQRRPFEGDTDSHVVVGILDHPVPPIEDAKHLPGQLIGIIDQALAKDPATRYQTAREMLTDLQAVSESSGLGSGVRPLTIWRHGTEHRRLRLAAGIAAALLFACAVWWWGLNGKEAVLGPDWFRIESVRQLTFNGRTTLSCISPDGKYLAFVTGDPGGMETLYLKQVDQSSEEVKIPARKIDYVGLTFSPDSQTIFEVERDEKLVGRLYTVPILADRSSAPLIIDIDGPVSFSPSGDQFVFMRWVNEDRSGRDAPKSIIETAQRDGSRRKALLAQLDFTISPRLAWAPKGDRIASFAFSNSTGGNGTGVLELVDLQGHAATRALPNWRVIGQPSWVGNGKTLIVSAATRTEARSRQQLRELAIRHTEIHDVTKDLAGYVSASLTRDGRQLAAVKAESKASLWISSPGDPASGQNAPAEADEHPTLAWLDEEYLILNSQRSGFPNLWLFDVNNQNRTSLTSEPFVEQDAVSIPGSKSVLFSSNRSGEFHLWRFDPESNQYTQLTSGSNYDEKPSVTRDGNWIVYTSWNGNNPRLYRISKNGGTPSPLGPFLARDPDISPDGKRVVCQMQDPNTLEWRIAWIPFEGAGQPKVIPGARLPVRWSPDGSGLTTVLTDGRGVSNIWAIPLNGSPSRQLTRFDEQGVLKFAWSPNGDRLACIRATSGSDVVLFNRQRSR